MCRKNWTFAGSDAGGHRAVAVYTLTQTARLNDVEPQDWLADIRARLQEHPARRVGQRAAGPLRTQASRQLAAWPEQGSTVM